MRMMTIHKPGPKTLTCAAGHAMSCYVALPALDLHGTWPTRDLLTPEETAGLAILANRLEKVR